MAKRRRYLHPGEPMGYVPTPQDVMRFLKYVRVDETTRKLRGSKCWLWTACSDTKGYGQMWLGGKARWAHRASYELFHARVRRGQDIDHICRNRSCVCPRHLRATTRPINSSRNRRVYVPAETMAATIATDDIPF